LQTLLEFSESTVKKLTKPAQNFGVDGQSTIGAASIIGTGKSEITVELEINHSNVNV